MAALNNQIISLLQDFDQLEKLYRQDKNAFKKAFNSVYPQLSDQTVAQVWNQRLNFETDDISFGTRTHLLTVIVLVFLAGLVAKIPNLFAISAERFYLRNIAFIVFPFLAAYFIVNRKSPTKHVLVAAAICTVSVIYINLLPNNADSNTLILACMHLPFLLWGMVGYVFVGGANNNGRVKYLQYNGDLLVMSALIFIAGAILAALSLNLFALINIRVEQFYQDYLAVWGLAGLPIVATYLVQTNPQLVSKVSPVIAKVFSPVVLITLVAYLCAIIYSGKDPYNDREFLLLFNAMLLGVMAIILFSVAEMPSGGNKAGNVILLLLSLVTIIVNGIALSAIVYRIIEGGITPNRLAVFGSNVLILVNLVVVAYRLFKTVKNREDAQAVVQAITAYIPVYLIWIIVVVFIFPLIFRFA